MHSFKYNTKKKKKNSKHIPNKPSRKYQLASTLLVTLSAEEEWEGELEAELKDFEIVPGDNKKTTSSKTGNSFSVSSTASVKEGKEDWEQQMDELLDEDEDLK